MLYLVVCKSKEKEKEKKRNINNNLAVLPSHDTWTSQSKLSFFLIKNTRAAMGDLEG